MERKRELMRLYDETSDFYDSRYMEIQRRKHEVVIEHLPSDLTSVLDVGCGSGLLLQRLSERAKVVVGVDFSWKMLEVARRRADGARLVLADAEALPFKGGAFDAVVSTTLLQNVPSPERASGECVRVLKSGGILVLTTLKRKHSPEGVRRMAESSGVSTVSYGEIPESEDVFCIAKKL